MRTRAFSEPVPAFIIGCLIQRSLHGWSRVVKALSRLLSSMRVVTVNAGAIGELVAQLLIVCAVDRCRFAGTGATASSLSAATARQKSEVPFVEVLKALVRHDKHQDLVRLLDKGGMASLVRFRETMLPVTTLSQQELEYLWRCGEGIKGAPNQAGWDLFVPIRYPTHFSVWIIQIKNLVAGPCWLSKYTSLAPFPRLPMAEDAQMMLSFMNHKGARRDSRHECHRCHRFFRERRLPLR